MALRLNTNVASMIAQRHVARLGQQIERHFARLSTGLRIVTAADDPAGLGVSERMRAELRSLKIATRNIEDGLGFLRIADGALAQIGEQLHRLRELAVRAMTGTLSADDREMIGHEYDEIVKQVRMLFGTAEFNGRSVFTDFDGLEIQVGDDAGERIFLPTADLRVVSAILELLDLGTPEMAGFTARVVDTSQHLLRLVRGWVGADMSRLDSALRSTRVARDNLSRSESRIRDVDFARETALLAKDQVVQKIALAAMAQATLDPAHALELLWAPVHARRE